MKTREIGNAFLHLAVGLLLALAASWNHWMLVPVTFIYAFLREQAQHRYILTLHEPPPEYTLGLWNVQKRTFFDFGWLGKKQAFEIAQWTLGAAIGCGLWELIQ